MTTAFDSTSTLRRREPGCSLMGTDTFRGTGSASTLSRTLLYGKNMGDTTRDQSGLVRTDSPVSGNLLVHAHGSTHAVRDPIAGSTLRYHGNTAIVTAPVAKQQLKMSRNFYLTKDIDVTIQT